MSETRIYYVLRIDKFNNEYQSVIFSTVDKLIALKFMIREASYTYWDFDIQEFKKRNPNIKNEMSNEGWIYRIQSIKAPRAKL